MKLPGKGLLVALFVALGLFSLLFAGAWSLGLLPLIFFSPGATDVIGSGTETEPANNLGIYLPELQKNARQTNPEGSLEQEAVGGKQAKSGAGRDGEAGETNPSSSAGEGVAGTGLRRQIEARYTFKLQTLARSYEGKLNDLVAAAWNEYSRAKQQNQKIAVIFLAGKYLKAGNELEARCDAEFYSVLGEFKAELRKNSFPLDTALQAQREYERAKAARKRAILATAAKYF